MVHKFRKWSDICDDDSTGRPSTSRTDAKAAWVDENRLATNWDLCSHYSCPSELYRSTSLPMKNWNTAKYVHALYRDTRRKNAKIDVSRFLFHIFSDCKKTDTSFFISSDRVDTWVYHFTPRTQQAGVRWKHPASPTVSVFWHAESVIYVEYMPRCRSGNVNALWDTLPRLREPVSRKRLGHHSWGLILQLGYTTPHSAHRTQELFESFDWELLDHILVMTIPRRTRVRVAEADSTVQEVEWLFLKGCDCKIRICGEGISKLLQKWDSAWMCLGFVFKSSVISVK